MKIRTLKLNLTVKPQPAVQGLPVIQCVFRCPVCDNCYLKRNSCDSHMMSKHQKSGALKEEVGPVQSIQGMYVHILPDAPASPPESDLASMERELDDAHRLTVPLADLDTLVQTDAIGLFTEGLKWTPEESERQRAQQIAEQMRDAAGLKYRQFEACLEFMCTSVEQMPLSVRAFVANPSDGATNQAFQTSPGKNPQRLLALVCLTKVSGEPENLHKMLSAVFEQDVTQCGGLCMAEQALRLMLLARQPQERSSFQAQASYVISACSDLFWMAHYIVAVDLLQRDGEIALAEKVERAELQLSLKCTPMGALRTVQRTAKKYQRAPVKGSTRYHVEYQEETGAFDVNGVYFAPDVLLQLHRGLYQMLQSILGELPLSQELIVSLLAMDQKLNAAACTDNVADRGVKGAPVTVTMPLEMRAYAVTLGHQIKQFAVRTFTPTDWAKTVRLLKDFCFVLAARAHIGTGAGARGTELATFKLVNSNEFGTRSVYFLGSSGTMLRLKVLKVERVTKRAIPEIDRYLHPHDARLLLGYLKILRPLHAIALDALGQQTYCLGTFLTQQSSSGHYVSAIGPTVTRTLGYLYAQVLHEPRVTFQYLRHMCQQVMVTKLMPPEAMAGRVSAEMRAFGANLERMSSEVACILRVVLEWCGFLNQGHHVPTAINQYGLGVVADETPLALRVMNRGFFRVFWRAELPENLDDNTPTTSHEDGVTLMQQAHLAINQFCASLTFTSQQQRDATILLLSPTDRHLLLVAPTGSGKTAAVVAPALLHSHVRILILCPFRALVDTMIERLNAIRSGLAAPWRGASPSSQVIVACPEAIQAGDALTRANFHYVALDECHNLQQSALFRPPYRELPSTIKQHWPNARLVLLSGTLTPALQQIVVGLMGISDATLDVVRAPCTVRTDMSLLVQRVDNDEAVRAVINDLLAGWISHFSAAFMQRNAIIFCPSPQLCEEMLQSLSESLWCAASRAQIKMFHADLPADEKASVLRWWMPATTDTQQPTRLLVATHAMAEGIDKPDVSLSAVAHGAPTLALFLQELSRAGRAPSKQPAVGCVIYCLDSHGAGALCRDATAQLDSAWLTAQTSRVCMLTILSRIMDNRDPLSKERLCLQSAPCCVCAHPASQPAMQFLNTGRAYIQSQTPQRHASSPTTSWDPSTSLGGRSTQSPPSSQLSLGYTSSSASRSLTSWEEVKTLIVAQCPICGGAVASEHHFVDEKWWCPRAPSSCGVCGGLSNNKCKCRREDFRIPRELYACFTCWGEFQHTAHDQIIKGFLIGAHLTLILRGELAESSQTNWFGSVFQQKQARFSLAVEYFKLLTAGEPANKASKKF